MPDGDTVPRQEYDVACAVVEVLRAQLAALTEDVARLTVIARSQQRVIDATTTPGVDQP